MNYLLSVVIPVYNAEKYLTKCINSILNQTFTKFELLLIDDGSSDNSLAICNNFALVDYRVKVFHQENQGASVARNRGILESTAKYICFIDSDDWIDLTYLANFFHKDCLDNTLIVQGMTIECSNKRKKYLLFTNESYAGNEVGKCIVDQNILNYGSPCGKLYSMDIIKSYNILFPENISYGEDTLFFLNYLTHIDTIEMLSFTHYHYRYSYNTNSLSKKKHHPFTLLFFYNEFYRQVLFLNKKYNISDRKYLQRIDDFYFRGLIRTIINITMYNLSFEEISSFKKEILRHLWGLKQLSWHNSILNFIVHIIPFKISVKLFGCYR